MEEPNSGSQHSGHGEAASPYFFDRPRYPSDWEESSDETLVTLYQSEVRQRPFDPKVKLIVCFLMKRHKAGIILISKKYLKTEDEIVEFTHDLFLKLVKKLITLKIKVSFGGFLLTTINHTHIDRHRRKKKQVSFDAISSAANPVNLEDQISLKLDFPLSEEKLTELKERNVLSAAEYACISLLIQGYKPREITYHVGEEVMGMNPQELLEDKDAYYAKKKKKVYGALERARKKLRG